MAKLCYRVKGVTQKYDLRESANTPRLAVKINGVVKYLPLEQSEDTKPDTLAIKIGGQRLYIKTWSIDNSAAWRGMSPEEPFRGMVGTRGDTTHGGLGIWVLVNEENYPVVLFGRIGADRYDDWADATWWANRAETTDVTRWPTNFTLTQEQLQHPLRLKANIRLATISSACYATEGQVPANTTTNNGDIHSSKNYVRLSDIVTSLTSKSSYLGYSGYKYEGSSSSGTGIFPVGGGRPDSTSAPAGFYKYRHTGYGYYQLDNTGIYFPNGQEETMGLSGVTYSTNSTGIDSQGFKVTSYLVKEGGIPPNGTFGAITLGFAIKTGVSTSTEHYGAPYISYSGVMDEGKPGYGYWAQRDFYLEFPYAWGEDTNPNDFFTFSPRQVLNAVKVVATEKGIADYDYGFVRGRNY